MSQKDYLKKYLSGDKKKSKKKKSTKSTKVKIIDDDAHGANNMEDIDEDLLFAGEDAPQIVEVIDDRPDHMKNELSKPVVKWKSLSVKEEPKHEIESDTVAKSIDSDLSPPRNRKRKESSDISPPRRRKLNTDASPVRRRRNDSNSDVSPPRRKNRIDNYSYRSTRKDGSSADDSPRKRIERTRFKKDQSPPRKSHRDILSPKHIKVEKDSSPVRKPKACDLENLSTQMHTNRQDERKSRRSPSRKSRWAAQSPKRLPSVDQSPPRIKSEDNRMEKTLDGKRSGLQKAKALKTELEELKERENKHFESLSSEISGRNAEVQVRKTNRSRKYRKSEQDEEAERAKEAREKEKAALYNCWGKGLKQIEAYRNKISDENHEGSKPLARYSDDVELDEMLKNQERAGDPMLEYIRSKQKETNKGPNKLSVPIYKGPFPENRFNIRPGYRWDGLDRSNGYEQKWFDVQNQKKALQDEAYKYSTEDM